MSSSDFIDLRINNAEQFVESISEVSTNSKIYFAYGKCDAWANDAVPGTANSSIGTVYEIWSNMIGGKRLFGGDFHHVIPRHNWTSNTVYQFYDHRTPDLHNSNSIFYVVNSAYSVYKCLSNNRGAVSSSEPTAVNPEATTTTGDSYIWKYMYTLSDVEQIRFMSDSYIPVKTLMADGGSQQWQVQNQASDGAIHHIIVTSGGSNYSNASTISIAISGDGSGAYASASINTTSNVITSITVTEPGLNYTYATVTIADSGSGTSAAGVAIISPPGGHGSNPLYELGGKNVMINPRLKYSEGGILPDTNDFRQICLIRDPYTYGNTSVASSSAFLQAYKITCDGTGNYNEDELVYQGTSLAAATFSGRVVSWDVSTSQLRIINIRGIPSSFQSIIGSSSFTTRVITSVITSDLEPHSGRMLYVDNIVPVSRSSDQTEDFRILLKF